MTKISSLYVHIPFCEHICTYCDFCKMFYNEKLCDKYLNVLINELNNLKIKNKLKTIYIGGGSPSCLNEKELEKLLKELNKYLDINYEFTIEVNPENITEEKVKLFKKYGINRVSIGVQSFNKDILNFLGRKHDFNDVKRTVDLLNKYDITNYSFDFIYGIKGLTIEMIKKDLELIFSLNPKHLSFYSLILEDNTIIKVNNYKELDEDNVREQYDFIYDELYKRGYIRYEVSNFAKDNYESKHNLVYWNNEEYYAIGVGASSYVNGIRYTTSRNITKYVNNTIEKESFITNKEKEYIMLKLRLVKGIDLNEYKKLFKKDFFAEYKDITNKFLKNNLLIIDKNYLKTTYNGMMLLDSILVEYM